MWIEETPEMRQVARDQALAREPAEHQRPVDTDEAREAPARTSDNVNDIRKADS